MKPVLSHMLCRSALYVPASHKRALEKSTVLPADILIFDLEDAISPDAKIGARQHLVQKLATDDNKDRAHLVRINALDATTWGLDDLRAVCSYRPTGILVPKVNTANDLIAVEAILSTLDPGCHISIWAMIETPLGVLNIHDIATSTPRLRGLVMGTNDLLVAMNAHEMRPARTSLLTALNMCVMAAKAYGLVCLDGVHNTIHDIDGLTKACEQGRALGFDGKTLIHPVQIYAAHKAFSPSVEEVRLARLRITAFENARARHDGVAVAVVEGAIVESLHAVQAARTLAQHEQIRQREEQEREFS